MLRLLSWFQDNARDLPWRQPGTTPWAVLVSEVMLQQTPVARVLPVWTEWMERWPTPATLAEATSADVLYAWGRLGYPRRALWLHQAAARIQVEYGGVVPSETAALRSLPGVGEYTAAAVQSFAFNQPSVVIDVNIQRVFRRVSLGIDSGTASTSKMERALARTALEMAGEDPTWNAAIMEFGALVCTARNPGCADCPVRDICQWNKAGRPESPRKRRAQEWKGTDRQVRGKILEMLRRSPRFTAPTSQLLLLWDDRIQFERALRGLRDDGLIHPAANGRAEYVLGPAAPASDEQRC